jgi:hypothetical protein
VGSRGNFPVTVGKSGNRKTVLARNAQCGNCGIFRVHAGGGTVPSGQGRFPWTENGMLVDIAIPAAIGSALISLLAITHLWSKDSGQRERAIALIRLLLRR